MRSLLLLIVICTIMACKDEHTTLRDAVDDALENYRQYPTNANAEAFAQARKAFIDAYGYTDPAVPDYLIQSARIDWTRGNQAAAFSSFQLLMTRYKDYPGKSENMLEMIRFVETFNKPALNQVMYKSFVEGHPEHPAADSVKTLITEPHITVDATIRALDLAMFDVTRQLLDKEKAQLFIEMCELSVLLNDKFPQGPEHLYRAAEIARVAKLANRAIKVLTWIREYYPDHPLATSSLLFRGYIYDHDLNNQQAAKAIYEKYLKDDPYGPHAETILWLLANLGKPEAEIQNTVTPDALRQYVE